MKITNKQILDKYIALLGLTSEQACSILGCSRQNLSQLAKSRKIRTLSSYRLYNKEDVLNLYNKKNKIMEQRAKPLYMFDEELNQSAPASVIEAMSLSSEERIAVLESLVVALESELKKYKEAEVANEG